MHGHSEFESVSAYGHIKAGGQHCTFFLNVLLTVHRDISYNKNQQDALFTLNLFQ